jgi:hypothetical protein
MRSTFTKVALILSALAGPASAADVGLGAFGGVSIPVVHEAAKQGSLFGVRLPVRLVPMVTFEPYYSKAALGDGEVDAAGFPYTRDGGDVTSFGVNALLTFGGAAFFKLFPIVGLGSYRIEREAMDEIRKAGYNFGLGFGLSPIPKLTLSVRGELALVPTGETSQKFASVTVGADYGLISVPRGGSR